MGIAATEQDTIRNDTGTTAADFKHLDEKRNEEEFRFARTCYSENVFADILLENIALERRVRHNKRVSISCGVIAGNSIHLYDVGFLNSM